MNRRAALRTVAAAATAGLAGCLAGGPEATPTETDDPGGEPPTDTPAGSTLVYYVVNEDDEPHSVEVVLESADGTEVHRRADADLEPGEQLSGTVKGLDPAKSPFPFTVALGSIATTVDLKADECPEYDVLVAIDAEGQPDVKRAECIK